MKLWIIKFFGLVITDLDQEFMSCCAILQFLCPFLNKSYIILHYPPPIFSIVTNPSHVYTSNFQESHCTAVTQTVCGWFMKQFYTLNSFGLCQTFQRKLQLNGWQQWLCNLRPCALGQHKYRDRRIESHCVHECSLCSLLRCPMCWGLATDQPPVQGVLKVS